MIKEEAATDGRYARSTRSRQQIVDALFSLIRKGELDPSASDVAHAAKVGLRTVFRHFEDMDSLYREMSVEIEKRVWPHVLKPFEAQDWKDQVRELVDRRATVFEEILPLRVCAMARRFRSKYLFDDHTRVVALERSIIENLIPSQVDGRKRLVHELDLILCFESWHRLRRENGLTLSEAKEVLTHMLNSALGQA